MGTKLKKSMSIMLTIIIISIFFASTAIAYGSQSISFEFNSSSDGRGYVNGSKNGKYYSLSSGRVHAELVDRYYCANGTYYISLYQKDSWFGMGTSYGRKTCNAAPGNSHYLTWSVDDNSSKYYLFISGTGTYKTYTANGTFYDY